MPAALNEAIPSLHALHKPQRLLFFAELLVQSNCWHCHKVARAEADLSVLGILQRIRSGGSVTHDIENAGLYKHRVQLFKNSGKFSNF
jgi:hypothetical protein